MADWRRWCAHALVLGAAALAGLSVVGFTWLCGQAFRGFEHVQSDRPWLALVWTPAWTAGLVWLTARLAPGAGGSGIPQLMAALSLQAAERPRYVSLRLALEKGLLTAGGLLGGLTVGREGPSVQIAGGIVHSVRRWLPEGTQIDQRSLLIAGGAAGVAASFNAPLAGVMFAIETLAGRMERMQSGLVIGAIALAGLVAVSVSGNGSYFGVIRVDALEIGALLPGLLVAVVCGLFGGLLSRLLLISLLGDKSLLCRWRRDRPVMFAAGCGILIAAVGLASGGTTFGGGSETTRQLIEGTASTPVLYVPLRFIATWLTAWSGVPGGLFLPSLSIGAGIGNDIAMLVNPGASPTVLIAIGMASFLAAVTQAPGTAFIVVMEMVDGRSMVLSLMASAMLANLISRWTTAPLYSTLAAALIAKSHASSISLDDPKASRNASVGL